MSSFRFSEEDVQLNLNEPALRGIQMYSGAILLLFAGLFLMLIVGVLLFFVAFYVPTFGMGLTVGTTTTYYISKNTQAVAGTLAGLSIVLGIFLVAGSARMFQRSYSIMDWAKRVDMKEYQQLVNPGFAYSFPLRRLYRTRATANVILPPNAAAAQQARMASMGTPGLSISRRP